MYCWESLYRQSQWYGQYRHSVMWWGICWFYNFLKTATFLFDWGGPSHFSFDGLKRRISALEVYVCDKKHCLVLPACPLVLLFRPKCNNSRIAASNASPAAHNKSEFVHSWNWRFYPHVGKSGLSWCFFSNRSAHPRRSQGGCPGPATEGPQMLPYLWIKKETWS